MPRSRRAVTWLGIFLQGFAIYAGFTRSLVWPVIWPKGVALFPVVLGLYYIGYCLQNAMVTSEFLRKTQLESEQLAAQEIQRTLQPAAINDLPGYEVESFYKPLRAVGGDYFDVIDLSGERTLLVVADVSGKGMPAALLASSIQALTRVLAHTAADLSSLAVKINDHLCRYSPGNRFATAVFIVLDRASGEVLYVNAGHNPPIVSGGGSTTRLEATGMALGWFPDAAYGVRTTTIPPRGRLLLFTDGLTDSMSGEHPEDRLCEILADEHASLAQVEPLVDPAFNADDVTVLLVKRATT